MLILFVVLFTREVVEEGEVFCRKAKYVIGKDILSFCDLENR